MKYSAIEYIAQQRIGSEKVRIKGCKPSAMAIVCRGSAGSTVAYRGKMPKKRTGLVPGPIV